METPDARPTVLFWMISIALLLWGLGGASIYVAYFIEAPERFAETAETAANRQAYAGYIEKIPFWAIAIGMIAAATRLLGAIGLLRRRAWALPLYIVSMASFSVAFCRAVFLAHVTSVMSRGHFLVELTFLGLSVFAVWFARRGKSTGILQ